MYDDNWDWTHWNEWIDEAKTAILAILLSGRIYSK